MNDPVAEILFGTDTLRVEHVRHTEPPATRLAVSFTGWGHDTLDGLGYEGQFLLDEGYDLLAFKLIEHDWYQTVPAELFDWIKLRMARFGYQRRVGYGAAMGGYAAIQFSGRLGLDQVLAYSPQYRIDEAFDTTWASWAEPIDFQYRIDAHSLSAGGKYLILFDSRSPDQEHVRRLAAIIPPERLTCVAIPFARHPVDGYLSQIGVLKQVAREGLASGQLDGIDLRRPRAHSSNYFGALAMTAHARGRQARSLAIVERALQRFPAVAEFHTHRTVLLDMLGDTDGALKAAQEGVQHCPDDHDLIAYASQLLERQGDVAAAVKAIEQALAIAPDHPPYLERYAALLAVAE